MHKKMIKQLIARGRQEDMEYLEELLDDVICDLKTTNYNWYSNIELDMYKRLYGYHLTEELAREWVSGMENKDGTKGQHWSIEQTNQFANGFDKNDFYATLNMMYSDYYNPKFDTDIYVELAKDWLNDKDVGEGKTLCYYWKVVK